MLNNLETEVEMETTTQLFLGSDEFSTYSSEAHYVASEDSVLFGTTNDSFSPMTPHSEINYSISTSTPANTTEIHHVFSDYPRELLCFGAICFIAFAVVGVLGNFISILALSRCKRLRNATTAFIVNLCVADLLFCSLSMPLSAVQFIDENWYFGDVLCKLVSLIRYSNGAVSLFSVIAITVNRYILICHPRFYTLVYSKGTIAIMIAFMWLMSILVMMFPLLEIWGRLGYDSEVGTCTILEHNGKSPKIFLYISAFGIPSAIFIVCYTRIFFAVRKASKRASRKEDNMTSSRISFTVKRGWLNKSFRHSEMPKNYTPHRDRKELRVLRVMLVIFILFLVCYFPVSFIKIFRKEKDLKYLNVLGYLGVYFSNIINPVIYILMSEEYRRAYKELFCCSNSKRQTLTNS